MASLEHATAVILTELEDKTIAGLLHAIRENVHDVFMAVLSLVATAG